MLYHVQRYLKGIVPIFVPGSWNTVASIIVSAVKPLSHVVSGSVSPGRETARRQRQGPQDGYGKEAKTRRGCMYLSQENCNSLTLSYVHHMFTMFMATSSA